jgi:hypothetical protein
MRNRWALVLLLGWTPLFASDPGQPYDCADLTITEPGVTCSIPYTLQGPVETDVDMVVDNQSRHWRFVRKPRAGWICNATQMYWSVFEVLENGVFVEKIRSSERCIPPSTVEGMGCGSLSFDAHAGKLYCWSAAGGNTTRAWVFEGFATTFDLRQTYVPPATLSLQIPVEPEGLDGDPSFDTYWGALGTPIQLADAQPLQCGFPAQPVQVGDRLTVADPLPNPATGEGYWYLTAVTSMGETRAGRRATGGILSGRDASALPECVEPN